MATPWDSNATPEDMADDFDAYADDLDAQEPSNKSWEECFPAEDSNTIQGKW